MLESGIAVERLSPKPLPKSQGGSGQTRWGCACNSGWFSSKIRRRCEECGCPVEPCPT